MSVCSETANVRHSDSLRRFGHPCRISRICACLCVWLSFIVSGCGFPSDESVGRSFTEHEREFAELLVMIRADEPLRGIGIGTARAPGSTITAPSSGPIKVGAVVIPRRRWDRYQSLLRQLHLIYIGVNKDQTVWFRARLHGESEKGLEFSPVALSSCQLELVNCKAAPQDIYMDGGYTYSKVYRLLKPNWYIYLEVVEYRPVAGRMQPGPNERNSGG